MGKMSQQLIICKCTAITLKEGRCSNVIVSLDWNYITNKAPAHVSLLCYEFIAKHKNAIIEIKMTKLQKNRKIVKRPSPPTL